jgi:hypothetical protein
MNSQSNMLGTAQKLTLPEDQEIVEDDAEDEEEDE